MSSTSIEQVMPVKLAQALANPLFPAPDNTLRPRHHIGLGELDDHVFLMDFQEYLEEFCVRCNIELICTLEGFFYLRPRSTTLILRSVLSELDMMVGKILCYLYLGPERLANEGTFTQQELCNELLTPADEVRLLKLVNNHSADSDVDRRKLQEKVRSPLNRLRRLGMMWFTGHDSSKLRIAESVFRFGADVRVGNDPRGARRRLIRDGETVPIENHLQLNNETKKNRPDSGEEE